MVRRIGGALGRWGVGAILILLSSPAHAFVRWYPVVGADFMLGQHFFNGDPSAWGGNLDLRVIPAVKFSEDFVLIPTFLMQYQGTKDVSELAGGGQLFQDSLKTSLNVKPVYRFDALRVKPSLGYALNYLRETKDEKLGKGLFDFRKLSAGLDLEYVLNPRQWVSLGFDYYTLRFPNYSSLESQAAAGLGRENEGARVLDSNNTGVNVSWDTDMPFPSTRGTFNAAMGWKDYPDQHTVNAAGQLDAGKRKDGSLSYGGALVWSHAVARALEMDVSAGIDQLVVRSNQDHYDANAAKYLEDYYSYQETAFRPAFSLRIPKKGSLTVSYTIAQRRYVKRPIQDEGGTYLAERTQVRSKTFGFGVSIPLAQHLKALVQSNISTSDSNQRYEKVFRYNYNIASHFLGVSYEY